jgi:hypothetical protein
MESRSDNEGERRSRPRYPVEAALEYRVIYGRRVATGRGKTLNLSSHCVLFQSDQAVAEGARIELEIAWPARLNDVVGLTWHVTGRTVWNQGTSTAVEIWRHEFRTRADAGRPGRLHIPPTVEAWILELRKSDRSER